MPINPEEVLNRLNIKYTIKNETYIFNCISPYHKDTHPSINMNSDGVYNCLSCPESGNLITLIKKITGKSVREFFGEETSSVYFKQHLSSKPRPIEIDEYKMELEGSLLSPYNNDEVMTYLNRISINNDFIKKFELKYSLDAHIRFKGGGNFTPMYKRICIPVYKNGKIVNMIGRDYTEINKIKEIYPSGSLTDIFFNEWNIDVTKPLVVVEGMKGLVRIWRYFTKNVISTFGSNLGKYQLKFLSKVPKLLLFADHDNAGLGMIDVVDKVRSEEYSVTWMRQTGYDPADGPLSDLEYALRHSMLSVDYYMNRNGMNKKPRLTWIPS